MKGALGGETGSGDAASNGASRSGGAGAVRAGSGAISAMLPAAIRTP